jgi:hypothetical protein
MSLNGVEAFTETTVRVITSETIRVIVVSFRAWLVRPRPP